MGIEASKATLGAVVTDVDLTQLDDARFAAIDADFGSSGRRFQ